MGLSIKSKETERAIRQLAAATGESLTQAVHTATVHRLEALGAPFRTREERMAEIKAWLAEVDARKPANSMSNEEIDTWMYDEGGAPR